VRIFFHFSFFLSFPLSQNQLSFFLSPFRYHHGLDRVFLGPIPLSLYIYHHQSIRRIIWSAGGKTRFWVPLRWAFTGACACETRTPSPSSRSTQPSTQRCSTRRALTRVLIAGTHDAVRVDAGVRVE
jgi:hypothetical protein